MFSTFNMTDDVTRTYDWNVMTSSSSSSSTIRAHVSINQQRHGLRPTRERNTDGVLANAPPSSAGTHSLKQYRWDSGRILRIPLSLSLSLSLSLRTTRNEAKLTTMPRNALAKNSSLLLQKISEAPVDMISPYSPFIVANATNEKKLAGANQYWPSTTPLVITRHRNCARQHKFHKESAT